MIVAEITGIALGVYCDTRKLSTSKYLAMARKRSSRSTTAFIFFAFLSIIAFCAFVPVFAPLPSLSSHPNQSRHHSSRHKKVGSFSLALWSWYCDFLMQFNVVLFPGFCEKNSWLSLSRLEGNYLVCRGTSVYLIDEKMKEIKGIWILDYKI